MDSTNHQLSTGVDAEAHVFAGACGPDPVTALALELKACLCAAAETCGRPLCWCCLYHGQTPPPGDVCDCQCTVTLQDGTTAHGVGMGWVRVVSVAAVPLMASRGRSVSGAGCAGVGHWEATFELGTYRCIESVSMEAPTCEARTADAVGAFADGQLLRWVATCCDVIGKRLVAVGQWQPLGPSGGCAGGTITVTLRVPPGQLVLPPKTDTPLVGRGFLVADGSATALMDSIPEQSNGR